MDTVRKFFYNYQWPSITSVFEIVPSVKNFQLNIEFYHEYLVHDLRSIRFSNGTTLDFLGCRGPVESNLS